MRPAARAQDRVAAAVGALAAALELERLAVEMVKRRLVADREHDCDARHTFVARRHEQHAVAVGVGKRLRLRHALARDPEVAIAARRLVAERVARVVDLEHRAEQTVTVLLQPAAHGQELLVRKPDALLPEVEHRLTLVRVQAHVDARLRELHGHRSYAKSGLSCERWKPSSCSPS
jgi:hypothetical protein